jgi:GT2 family glycosyltransferase/thymidylate kinase
MKNPSCIIISGLDGSGKTTLANSLFEYLRSKGYKTKYVWIRSPHTFAYLISRILIRLGWHQNFRNPNGIAVSRFALYPNTLIREIWSVIEFLSLLPLIIFKVWLPYLLGYKIVCDRYVIDSAVHIALTTKDMNFPDGFLGSLLLKTIPNNSVIIFLDAELSTVLERRPDVEYSIDEIKNEMRLYKKFKRKVKTFPFDSTTQSAEKIQKKVIDSLLAEPKPKITITREKPIITIGILTYNRSLTIPSVLEAVKNLEYPKNRIRIVFVDNNSQDNTLSILSNFKAQMDSYYESIIILSHEQRKSGNIPEGRNICISNSIGEYLLFIDSDVVPPSDTITRMLELFASDPSVAIVGFPCLSSPMTFFDKLYLHERPKKANPEVQDVIGMGSTMVKREIFNEIGLFDLEYSTMEDLEFSRRAKKAGYKIIMDNNKTALHLKQKKEPFLEIMEACYFSLTFEAQLRFKILRKYKPKYMIARLGIYSALIASFFLTIVSIVVKDILLSSLFFLCFGFLFIHHFLKCSGKWRLIIPFTRIILGVFFALGIYWQIIKNYMIIPCKCMFYKRETV